MYINLKDKNVMQQILLKACDWAVSHERLILQQGSMLDDQQLVYAREAGIESADRIKLLLVDTIPQPSDPLLHAACISTNFLGPNTAGLTLNYGIYIKRNEYGIGLLCHELAHVVQYQRLGGMRQFLEQYFKQLIEYGYSSNMPMEKEADETAAKILL
jgi:hypothetical protein